MIIAISGSRNWTNREFIRSLLLGLKARTGEILVGDARGVDAITRNLCEELKIPFRVFYADWDNLGKYAGVHRNSEMLDQQPDLLIAIHEDMTKSKGTRNMIKQASERGIEVKLFIGKEFK